MALITNKAKGPRGFNVKIGDAVEQVVLKPGEAVEAEMHDPDHPAHRGLIDSGDLEFEGGAPEPATEEQIAADPVRRGRGRPPKIIAAPVAVPVVAAPVSTGDTRPPIASQQPAGGVPAVQDEPA